MTPFLRKSFKIYLIFSTWLHKTWVQSLFYIASVFYVLCLLLFFCLREYLKRIVEVFLSKHVKIVANSLNSKSRCEHRQPKNRCRKLYINVWVVLFLPKYSSAMVWQLILLTLLQSAFKISDSCGCWAAFMMLSSVHDVFVRGFDIGW